MSSELYCSTLAPFEQEIYVLRTARPPVSYRRIAKLMKERHGVTVTYNAVFNFVRVRSRGRKVYAVRPLRKASLPATSAARATGDATNKNLTSPDHQPQLRPSSVMSLSPVEQTVPSKPGSSRRILRNFRPSLHYNLTRLTPEEKAALLERLQKGEH